MLGQVTVFCDTEGDGGAIQAHRVKATAATATALIAPRLLKVAAVTNGFCGFVPTNRELKFAARAGRTVGLDYTLEFNEQSMLGTDSRKPAGLRQHSCPFAEAGSATAASRSTSFPVPMGASPSGPVRVCRSAERGGLRFSALVGGVRTNSLAFPVFGRRC